MNIIKMDRAEYEQQQPKPFSRDSKTLYTWSRIANRFMHSHWDEIKLRVKMLVHIVQFQQELQVFVICCWSAKSSWKLNSVSKWDRTTGRDKHELNYFKMP